MVLRYCFPLALYFVSISSALSAEIGFTLFSTVTNQPIQDLRDGSSVDLASTGLELTLVADIKGPSSQKESVYFVRIVIDNSFESTRDEYVEPYSLGGDQNGQFEPVAALSIPGNHEVTAKVFDSFGSIVASKQLYFTVVEAVIESSVLLGFTLVDASNGLDVCQLVNDTLVDLFISGKSLTVRVDTVDAANNMEIKLTHEDGLGVVHNRPYALSAFRDSATSFIEAPALSIPGEHKITASLFDATGKVIESIVVTFTVTNRPFHSPVGEITGELREWHKITIGFEGPSTSETATPNPFTFYRLDVIFTHSVSDMKFNVPGYYAADGKAAHTRSTSGNVWFVHFSPPKKGSWTWVASFKQGENIAQNGGRESAGYFDGASGEFMAQITNKSGRDLRSKGLLRYVDGKHHLQFAGNGEWFLKVGADSPENFLAYEDFSKTPDNGGRRKSWNPHKQDFNRGDPTWKGGKGTGIIGAVNYLADQGMLAFSFLTMNINGDDKNVFPFLSSADRLRYDVSKLAQWEIVFEHADHKGMFLHFKTQETENDQLLDGGSLGLERKLYYRELVARFGHHLALNWNLGEENTNTVQQQKSFMDHMRLLDPYYHPIVVHTFPNEQNEVYGRLYGYPSIDGASVQTHSSLVFRNTLSRVTDSAKSGRTWVVSNDEQGNAETGVMPDRVDPEHDDIRQNVLWGNLMAGGAGVEYYFGYDYEESDIFCEDFRSRANMWIQSRYAWKFFIDNEIPFQNMVNNNSLVLNDSWCLVERSNGSVIVVYLRNGGSTKIELTGLGSQGAGSHVSVHWYDPRNGGDLQNGSIQSIEYGSTQLLGEAPNNRNKDWVVLLRCKKGC